MITHCKTRVALLAGVISIANARSDGTIQFKRWVYAMLVLNIIIIAGVGICMLKAKTSMDASHASADMEMKKKMLPKAEVVEEVPEEAIEKLEDGILGGVAEEKSPEDPVPLVEEANNDADMGCCGTGI